MAFFAFVFVSGPGERPSTGTGALAFFAFVFVSGPGAATSMAASLAELTASTSSSSVAMWKSLSR